MRPKWVFEIYVRAGVQNFL